MFSSDKNVESIAQLIEVLKRYIGFQSEFLKLNVIEKIVRLITALTLTIIFFILGIAVLFYLSFAAVYGMAPAIGIAWAFFVVALFFVALLILVYIYRKPWIERPLVRFLADVLLS